MKPSLWTPTFIGLAIANFGGAMIFYTLVPTMASYSVHAFKATPAQGGLVASVFFVGALAARPISGSLLTRFGARVVAIGAAVLYLATTLAYLVSGTLMATIIVRIFNGLGFGLLSTALTSAVMAIVPASRRGEGAGWFTLGMSLAIGLGPFAGISLANSDLGMPAVFGLSSACALLALILTVVLARRIPGRPEPTSGVKPSWWRSLFEPRAAGLGLVAGLGAIAYVSIMTYLDSATAGTDLAPAASVFFLVYAGVVIVSRPVAGRIQDLFGEQVAYLPALGGLVLGVAIVAIAGAPWQLLLGAAILGFGWGTVVSSGQAAAVNRCPPEQTGVAVATFFLLLDTGTALGPMLLGNLVEPLGYTGTFWAGTAVAAASLVLYATVVRRGAPSVQPPPGPREA